MANPLFISDLVVQAKDVENILINSFNVSLTYDDFLEGNAASMTKIIRDDLQHSGKFYNRKDDIHYYYHDPRYLKHLPKYKITAHLTHDQPLEITDPDAYSYSEIRIVFFRDIIDTTLVEMVSDGLSELNWYEIAVDTVIDVDML